MTSAAYLDFLHRMQPVHARGVRMELESMREALARLGLSPLPFTAVQVAGTNGKGSTVAMADAICRVAGVRSGLFTSPHFCRFTERVRIGGQEIAGDDVVRHFARVQSTGIALTYFEMSCAIALLAMAEAQVAVGWLETGLGGRLDAVTAVDAQAAAITTVGLDHMDMLGDSVAAIAAEKACVARPGRPLVVGRLDPDALAVVIRHAETVGAPVLRLGKDFGDPPAAPRLMGPHQHDNAAVASVLVNLVMEGMGRVLNRKTVVQGLGTVRWPGRLEWVHHAGCPVLLDCAHNVPGMAALIAALDTMSSSERPRSVVLSFVGDKDAVGMCKVLAHHFEHLIATQSSNPRTLPAAVVAQVAKDAGFSRVGVCPDPQGALEDALRLDGPVLVTGSIFLMGDLRAIILGEARDPIWGADPLPVRR